MSYQETISPRAVADASSLVPLSPSADNSPTPPSSVASSAPSPSSSINSPVNSFPPPDDSGSSLPHIAPFKLQFINGPLESKFRQYFFLRRVGLIRVTLPCLLIGFLALGISYDVLFVGDDTVLLHNRILRYGLQLPIILLFWLSTYSELYREQPQLFNSVVALALGALNIAVSVIGGQPDHGPQMLYFFVVYMFLQLRFWFAAAICWTLYAVFIITVKAAVPNSSRLGLSASYMTVSNVALMFACYATEYWLRLEFVRHNQLIIEEQRSDDLLQTLLPERITAKLKQLSAGDNLIAEEFTNVSMFFSDIVGFTAYSAAISAREVVNFLNTLYTTFDHLTVLHSVLKVETIGDAYFVASGVLENCENHAELLANFAFDCVHVLGQFKCKNNYKLQMRIGLHCGRVIAGVVGIKVPRYHLFGESVTIASLMESTGKPNQIQVSEPFAAQIASNSDYFLKERGGEEAEILQKTLPHSMKTYWLESAPELNSPLRELVNQGRNDQENNQILGQKQ
jgi:class 3 adenylate cyclase